MNERKIIDRKLFADLAKEVGLNASHLEALGESRHWEIVIDGDMLEWLVDIQRQFERLPQWAMMNTGDSILKCHGQHRKSVGCRGIGYFREI